ncbi:type II toxin-antitoxin system RatA family toxin [Afifella sp. IM 167]|uniref:type II toxin-antitoxin system RatA family toxin n=1 Tax=Afifella sp. IM 167 TaxID=2033586 RepID=UPI001CCF2DB9|nr:SRPBCC family protein [Afifella sp. IM 167]MBZ8134832.1 hypothetical protein [Afifella sp. IM 167]
MAGHLDSDTCVELACEAVFDMVADVESYPQFLPGFVGAQIVERRGDDLAVMQEVGLPGFTVRFLSYAHFDRPRHLLIRSREKPFRELRHEWNFEPLGPARTRVKMQVDFILAPGFLGGFKEALVRQFFARSVEAFHARAEGLAAARRAG